MKKLLYITSTLTVSLLADSSTDAKLLEMSKQIQRLQQEVQELRAQQHTIKTDTKEIQNETQENYNYIEEVEAKQFRDKLHFSLGFKTNLDNFDKKYVDGHTVRNNNVWSTKLMLNMKADITKNMNFYGRLSMYKYWGSSTIHPFTYYDNMQGRVPADSGLYVERAYLNWFLTPDSYIPFTITIGRQPSSDGPSNQFKDNTVRKGTYSALLYDGAADGIVFSADLSQMTSIPNTVLRLGYAKGFAYSENSPYATNAFIGPSNNDVDDTNVIGVFLDSSIQGIDNSFIQVSYSRMYDIIANPLDSNTNNNQNPNIGSVDMYGAMIEFTDFQDSHLDMFAHLGCSVAHPNGESYIIENPETGQKYYLGLLSQNGDTATKTGYAAWVGGRYSFGRKQKYKIGLEYNHGTQNWINLTQGSFDIYNKLSTRGNAYEAYLMYVINRYANLRFGYINIDYKYTRSGWFVGESKPISSTLNVPGAAESTVDVLQSYYLKMNVHF